MITMITSRITDLWRFLTLLVRTAPAAVCLLLCGCIFEYPDPSCFEDKTVNVRFDWSADTTATPEGMSVLFYPTDGGSYWRFELRKEGGSVRIPDGEYRVLTFNNDTGTILFENQDNYGSALITTRPARLTDGISKTYTGSQPPRRAEEEDQPVITQPDVVWSASAGSFHTADKPTEIILAPAPMVARYRVIADSVTNIESASAVAMAISSLSAGRVLSDGGMIPVDVTVPSAMRRTRMSTLEGGLLGFGRIEDRGQCLLSIYIILRDGSRKLYEYDVTSTISDAPDPLDVEIHVSGLHLPETETSGGTGMDVGVDDWDVVEIELST